ncbi:MAG TPA: phosphoenolpyruvate--protein phosphotransferase [Candidatus Eisenbacteria bacterium]|nr:phosphoenolpyruvate--protein phosphotransferase [Candidatus Eisenbacteria bacterium]
MKPDARKAAGEGAKKAKAAAKPRGSHGFRVLADVTAISADTEDLQDRLQRFVELIAERTETDVCSIYLFDERTQVLTLAATTGLERSAVGKVTMALGEGLTGMTLEKLEPVMVVDAFAHPRFKYFPETGEDRFHSYVGVPLVDGGKPLGVLVVQTLRRRKFTTREMELLRTIATSVSQAVVQARLVEDLRSKEQEQRAFRQRMVAAMKRLQALHKTIGDSERIERRRQKHARLDGLPAAPGYGGGRAHLIQPPVSFNVVVDQAGEGVAAERKRFARAVAASVAEVKTLKARLESRLPEFDSGIIEAYRMMLEDRGFLDKVEGHIEDGLGAESALKRVVDEYVETFSAMSDAYLRERATDVKDVGLRLLRNLLGIDEAERALERDTVLIADELSVSDLSLIDHAHLKGIVMATGGVTSHATILAKSFEIPTVVGAEQARDLVHEGDAVIVDGNSGAVFVNPTPEVAREYERLDRGYRAFNRELDAMRSLPAETGDGRRVNLYANIGLIADLPLVHRHGADGVGLYRTEFPFLTYRDFPTEDEQYKVYARVVRGMEGQPVTIRTLDIGADKYPSYLKFTREDNPFLGWRSIRISLELPEVFKTQLRAILRAGALGRVRLLFPMISSVTQIRRAKELLEEAKDELRQAGCEFDAAMPVGMMVEVPSAVALASHLIREVDFFSIGTNDLIQYLLAVDRNNHKVAELYEELHPAVLSAIDDTVQAARGAGKWVGMCGEMASNPLCTLMLLGLGLDDLSMQPLYIPVVKRIVRSVSFREVQALTRDVLSLSTVDEVKSRLFDGARRLGIIELVEMYH